MLLASGCCTDACRAIAATNKAAVNQSIMLCETRLPASLLL